MDSIRILIADDHTFYREGVRTMLSAMPEAEIVGEAASGDEAVVQAAALQPDGSTSPGACSAPSDSAASPTP